MWGISGRYSVAEDAEVWGLCSPGMRASLSTCRVLTSVGTWSGSRRPGGGVPLVGLQEELHGPSGYTGFTSSPDLEAKEGFSGFVTTNKKRRKKATSIVCVPAVIGALWWQNMGGGKLSVRP